MTGKLIDFLDEGVFVVQGEDGQEHDVSPEQIRGIQPPDLGYWQDHRGNFQKRTPSPRDSDPQPTQQSF